MDDTGPVRRIRLPEHIPNDVFVMCGVAFCIALGFGVVAPAIPLFAEQFGVSASAAGAVVSAFALMRLVSGLAAGRLIDLIGMRTGLIIGLAAVGVSSLFAGLAQSYSQLLILRGIGGVGSAIFGVAAISVVLHVAGAHIRGQAMSIYRSGFITGGIAGPAIGGAVLGLSYRAPFFLYAGTLVLSGVVALLFLQRPSRAARRAAKSAASTEGASDEVVDQALLEEAAPAAATSPDASADPSDDSAAKPAPEPTFWQVLRTTEYQVALTSNLAVGLAILGLRSTVVPLLIVDKIGAAPGWAAMAFFFSAIVETALMFPAGRWSDRVGRRPALLIGAFVSAGGLAVLGVGRNLPLVMIGMTIFGAGSAYLGVVPAALVGDVLGKRGGTVIAVFNMANDFGVVVGPVIAGWLVDRGSYGMAFGFGVAILVMVGLGGLRLPRGLPRAAQPARS